MLGRRSNEFTGHCNERVRTGSNRIQETVGDQRGNIIISVSLSEVDLLTREKTEDEKLRNEILKYLGLLDE